MNVRQKRFVAAYVGVAAGNATEAASIAGYSGDRNSLSSTAYELLQREDVRAAIEKRVEPSELIASAFERQTFWTKVMRDEERGMKYRLKCSELLARAQGDFIDRVEVSGSVVSAEYRVVDVAIGRFDELPEEERQRRLDDLRSMLPLDDLLAERGRREEE